MVKILKIYNGSNDIEGISKPTRMMKYRYLNKWIYSRNKDTGQLSLAYVADFESFSFWNIFSATAQHF